MIKKYRFDNHYETVHKYDHKAQAYFFHRKLLHFQNQAENVGEN